IEDENAIVFDVLDTPSGAGYLTEVFRKLPGVLRSVNIQHSVCAYGKMAKFFVEDHYLSETAWDKFSPYYKLANVDGLIFSFGLEHFLRNVTIIHCVESYFKDKLSYFASFFGKEVFYKYRDQDNTVK